MKKYRFLLFIILPIVGFELFRRPGFFPRDLKAFLTPQATLDLPVTITDVTQKSGILFTHQMISATLKDIEHIKGWVLGSGATVSVSDVNLDGYSDVYLTQMDLIPNKLFLNQKDGTFKDATAEFFPFPVNHNFISLKPTFFDCDNDGDQDIFLNTSSCPKLYRNDAGKHFTDITDKAGLSVCHTVNGNAVDFNSDGLLDLVYASYNIYGTSKQMDNFMNADRSREYHAIFRNKGQCQFEKVENVGIEDVGLTHSIGVVDLRGINRKDLWFVTDVATDRLFLDNGDGTYTNGTHLLKSAFNRHGMAFDVSYAGNNPRPDVYVSHVFSPTFMVEGNALWRMDAGGEIQDSARDVGVAECGHAWGGKFHDIDLDGDEDLLITNGFVSRNPKKDYLFPLALLGLTNREFMKEAKNWPKMNDASLYGYQKNCLFLREGEKFGVPKAPNAFTEDLLDGRAIVTLDVLNNGSPWVIVANQIQPVKVYQVEQKSNNNWIGFHLQGTCSNRDAFGTKVQVLSKGGPQVRWYYPSNGYSSQTESSLLYGLGKVNTVDEVTVRWPNGFSESFRNLAVNRYHKLSEGADCAR